MNRTLTLAAVALCALAGSSYGQLANISTRGAVGLGEDQLIAGFILNGTTTVVIRGLGPSLTSYGVTNTLPDPCLALYNSDSNIIAINNDWRSLQFNGQTDFGAFTPAYNEEAVIKTTLPAGKYTVILGGLAQTTGRALIEVYMVQ